MAQKIMIVDDESSVRITLKTVLKAEGYQVLEASNTDDALKKVKKSKPDLILLDIMMPGTPPAKFIRTLKDDPKFESIKIIYVTAVMGAKKAIQNNKDVIDTIEKPFKNSILLASIKKALS